MVTKTFKMMERTCRVYDKDSDEMKVETFTAKVTDKKWVSNITNLGYVLLGVIDEHETTYKLGMSDEDFFRLATVLK